MKSERGKLLYVNEHIQCKNYDHQSPDSLVEILKLQKGETYERDLKEPEIAFIYRGKIFLSFHCVKDQIVAKGKLTLLPPGLHISARAKEETYVFIIKLLREISLCEMFNQEELTHYTGDENTHLRTITANKPLKRYFDSFIPCVEDGIRCRHFLNLKLDELMIHFRAYYPKQEVAEFFLPLLGPEFMFKNFVYKNALTCRNVNELTEKSNMSKDGFLRRFKSVMGCLPTEYINGKKAERIRFDLHCGTDSFKVLADRYGFSTSAGFTSFCKKNLGATPSNIRAEKNINPKNP
ncbi:helix-turn-helix domain-containing protein [uncultured Alistipes sp.]|jgi:hypothetical protein|uniref:helix-turn-helix transcriptional regulator n=1 Tax=uncultured Alistipes sp. TaxID=538949 RepID=UPI0025E0CC48|nr:helix-turn-helix domain-containing protein [uncultured Alistipes sp.]